MYDFQARIPFDYAMQLAANFRAGDLKFNGDNLKLAGAIMGECGALLANGPFGMTDIQAPERTIEECIECLESQEYAIGQADTAAAVNPAVWLAAFQLAKLIIDLLSKKTAPAV